MRDDAYQLVTEEARRRGAKDVPRIVASAILAVRAGDPIDRVFDQLQRNMKDCFRDSSPTPQVHRGTSQRCGRKADGKLPHKD